MAICNSFTNAFDLECLFVNIFSGSNLIFIFVALIFIAIMAGRMRMFAGAMGVAIILFSILIFPISQWLFYVTIIIGLIISGLALANALNR